MGLEGIVAKRRDKPYRSGRTAEWVKVKTRMQRLRHGSGGRPRGARNKLGEAFLQDLRADLEKHGKSVIERVRRDDPSTYLRVMASVVRPASEPELESPFAHMTFEELKAELLTGFTSDELFLRRDRH
jgi:hypothetical protein